MERINHMEYLPDMEQISSEVMDRVVEAYNTYDYDKYTAADVVEALKNDVRTPKDFAALLSPAATPFIEDMARLARSRMTYLLHCS